MQNSISFAGLSLTQIFQIQSLQSLLIKFWYLGLTGQCVIAKDDQMAFKSIKKTVTFANCFTFEMPIKTYINFMDRIILTLNQIEPKKTFSVLLGHLRENKITNVTFELFGVAFLQLFGKLLQLLDNQIMVKIFRKIYIELTAISKNGTAIMKPDVKQIKQIKFEQFIPNLQELLNEKTLVNSKLMNPQNSLSYDEKDETNRDIRTLRGRLESQRNFNSSLREQESDQYPVGQKMRNKDKANLSCFMMGGFEIVDYSDSINQLHRKLLTKILLNK